MKVIDNPNVEALRILDVFEDLPVGTGGSACVISINWLDVKGLVTTYEHWNKVTKKQDMFRANV